MWRLLSDLDADGPEQMTRDEALLATAGPTSVRTYTWQPACLSLGYFQDYRSVTADLPEPIAVVRRITGGGAIWHQHEVTYAISGTLGQDGLPSRARDCYQPLHAAIRQALADAGGSPLQLQPETVGDRRYRDQPRCFASPAADDLVAAPGHGHDGIGAGKVLGSAARTRGERILIHGSLKLASNPWDGAAVAGCGLSAEVARAALLAGIASAFNATLEAGGWHDDELATRDRLRRERYDNRRWIEERVGPRA